MSGNLLLTGPPGIGKTTLLNCVAAELRERGLRLAGFTTDEVREGRRRTGFRLVPFNGAPRVLARVGVRAEHRVGRYWVDAAAVNDVSNSELSVDQEGEVFVVDEIGRMECFSDSFLRGMQMLLDSPRPVVATVALRGSGFIEEVKRRADVEIWEVSMHNRDRLAEEVVRWTLARCP